MVIKNIQVLRALAANAIMLLHLFAIEQRYGHPALLPEGLDFLSSGVDLFFVISGFIMALIVSSGESWRVFLTARITRIYPIYWVYTSILVLSFFVMPEALNRAEMPSFWRSYLLVPGVDYPILSAGWTLIHEMYFYLVIAAVLYMRLSLARALKGWAMLVLLSLLLTRADMSPIVALVTNPLTLEFILGAAVGLFVKRGFRSYGYCALVAGAVLFCASAYLFNDLSAMPLWQRPLFYGIPCALLLYAATAVREMASGWLVALGNASYSIYLSHILVLSTLGRVFAKLPLQGVVPEIGFLLACIVGANLFGWLSYRLLEKPLMRFFRRRLATAS